MLPAHLLPTLENCQHHCLSCPPHPVAPQVQLRYCMDKAPKLVEIIAALPEEHKAVLLPQ